MGKFILTGDMPNSCSKCLYEHDVDGYKGFCMVGHIYLGGLGVATEYETSRHPQCPLQNTTELLGALETLKALTEWEPTIQGQEESHKAYKKLHKALGGIE